MVFAGLENLAILAGEASHILRNYIPPSVFDEVFINYPDPPVWEYSQWLLVTADFLRVVHGLVRKGRCITIVTDDQDYAGIMLREFAKVADIWRSKAKGRDPSKEVPEGYGSSYFDRFWTQGNRNKRFYLQYEALPVKSVKNT